MILSCKGPLPWFEASSNMALSPYLSASCYSYLISSILHNTTLLVSKKTRKISKKSKIFVKSPKTTDLRSYPGTKRKTVPRKSKNHSLYSCQKAKLLILLLVRDLSRFTKIVVTKMAGFG